jgi:hypothetical protein
VPRLRILHIAHYVPYFLKNSVLSVFLINETYITVFSPYKETVRRRLNNAKISEASDVHPDRQSA